jgi:hypothetical protein
MRGEAMPVTVILQFADQGWHVRWRTSDTEEFEATRRAFKDTLSLRDYYWDPEAFNGKGGWWIAYGALDSVGHLFQNYRLLRHQLEQPYWQQFERQRQEARERFVREQEWQRETAQQQRQQKKARRRKEPQPKREDVKLPRTVEEALAILLLTPPVTASDIKRAYRTQTFKSHPDRGGSHAAMVKINAAYELALAAC